MYILKEGGDEMTKRSKELERLLNQKTLSSEEAVRLLELTGWERIRKSVGRKKSGTSHMYFWHPVRKIETCVPGNKKNLSDMVRKVIQTLARG